jgi:hypothetical protein
VVHEGNAATHVQEADARPEKRAFTLDELQNFFDYADEQVTRARDRKGWLPAFRDATLFKIAYSFGLRRNETRMLDVVDIGRNPQDPSSATTAHSTSASARPRPQRSNCAYDRSAFPDYAAEPPQTARLVTEAGGTWAR